MYVKEWLGLLKLVLNQECIIERERRVSHSVYALYAIPGNGSRPFVGVSTSAKPQARADSDMFVPI